MSGFEGTIYSCSITAGALGRVSLLARELVLADVGVHLPGAEDDAGKVVVVDGVWVGLGLKAESAVALREHSTNSMVAKYLWKIR